MYSVLYVFTVRLRALLRVNRGTHAHCLCASTELLPAGLCVVPSSIIRMPFSTCKDCAIESVTAAEGTCTGVAELVEKQFA